MFQLIRSLPALFAIIFALNACSESVDMRHQLSDAEQEPFHSAPNLNPQSSEDHPLTYQPWQQTKQWNSDAIEPPFEYYSAVIKSLQNRVNQKSMNLLNAEQEATAETLYIDFDGEDLTYGFDDQESFILCKDEASIPTSGLSLAEQEEIVSEVQRYFDDANVLLHVTDVRPASGDYTTIYVTGAIEDLGCEKNNSILGIAPLDKGHNNPNDIGFVFTRNLDPEEDDLIYTTALVVAHEAGHTYGLRHNDNEKAIMYPSAQPNVLGFGIGYARKLIFKTRQDSPKILRDVLDVLDPDLLPDEEEDAGLKTTWCSRIKNAQDFVLVNFSGFKLDSDWLKVPSFCEDSI